MEPSEIENKIRAILKRNFTILGMTGITVEDIRNEDHFLEKVGIDSMGFMGLISDVEKVFNFKIGDGEMTIENLGSIGKTVNYVSRKIN